MTDIGFGPLWRIDGPLPIPQERGLLKAADAPAAGVQIVVDQQDGIERWINGVQLYPYPWGCAEVYRACGTGTDADSKGFGEEARNEQFEAMTLWLAATCTTSRTGDHDLFKRRLMQAFEAVESAAMAREFQAGDKLNEQPYLADGVDTVFPNNDAATSPVNALALLEEQIALSCKQGIIHASPMLATALMGRGFALADSTGVIRTINGIVVIADFGYAAGATPNGHPDPGANQEWAYATGTIEIRRTEAFVMPTTRAEAVDRGSGGATMGRSNSVTYRAERYALVDWDTEVHAAVLVDRCSTTC